MRRPDRVPVCKRAEERSAAVRARLQEVTLALRPAFDLGAELSIRSPAILARH
jgi:hypothetical protein